MHNPFPADAARPRKRSKKSAFQRICVAAGHAIRDYRMIRDGDHLLVGLSGGEDSMILMHVLHHLQHRAPIVFRLTAATVDMDFGGFDTATLAAYCRQHGWEHRILHVPGSTIIAAKNTAKRPCALCSRLRRGRLHGEADRLGCNKLVLGQHLDDLCTSLLLSLFRGGGLKTMGPHVPADAGSKRLLRPLCYVTKETLHEAARDFRLPRIKNCPYLPLLESDGDRARMERLLRDMAVDIPDVRSNMLASMKRVQTDHLLDPAFLSFPENTDDSVPPRR